MPISTNLNRPPYFNTFDIGNDFYRENFQPSVSVQTRELNELQSILQNQIEQFGDNIFKTGSIVSGCNFQPLVNYPYATINDLDNNGVNVNVTTLQGYTIQNDTSGLRAFIVNFADGFQSTPPNLKTLYITYQNSGTAGNLTAFSPGDTTRVFDATINGVESIVVNGGGIGFSNTDTVIAESVLVVTVTSGTLTNGDYLGNGLGANVQIVSSNTTALANTNQIIVTVAPRITDLSSTSPNSNNWTFAPNQTITNPAATTTAIINSITGAGFVGKIVTNGVGSVQAINVLQKGFGYTVSPYMTIQSANAAAGNYSGLNLSAQNYVCLPIISGVGSGYGFSITTGVIFQNGTFLRVNPQQIIVDKYSNLPDNVAVSFAVNESIVNYNIDSSLLDNVNSTENFQAPGADRLKMVPVLQLTDAVSAASNSQLLTLATWQDGNMFQQNQQSVYNVIGAYVADRIEDLAGNYVVDPWLVTTSSPSTNEGEFVNVVVDPGTGYINGFKVQTIANFQVEIEKGIQTTVANNHFISLNYGNYVIVQNLGGVFQFNTGDQVVLYDTAVNFVTNLVTDSESPAPAGNIIGNANIRNLVLNSGEPGTPTCQYQLYLFNILMNPGANFANVKSIYYNGTHKGIADIVLQSSQIANGASVAVLQNNNLDQLLFDAGVESLKNANTITYAYRTLDQTVTFANTGLLVKSISSLTNQIYPYSSALSSSQLNDFIVIPTSADIVANNNAAGTVTANNVTANLVGSSTSFLTTYVAGDYIYVTANSSGGHDLHQIQNVVNNTLLILDSNCSYSNTTAITTRVFPKNVAIPFGYRSGLSGNVDVTQQVLTMNLGNTFSFSGTVNAAITTNIQISQATQGTKSAVRNAYVLICCGNNAGGTTGSWSFGVPDVFRLRSVFIGNSSVSNTGTNYVSNFYCDNNQNTDFYNLSQLFLQPKSNAPISNTSYLLVQFDYFTSSGKFFDTVSYLGSNSAAIFANDSLPLGSLGANVNTFEVPELFDGIGDEYDLLHYFDFRPLAANTCNPSLTYSSAPLNPNVAVTFNTSVEKQFPVPNSLMQLGQIEYYLGRTDAVYIDYNTNITVVEGTANAIPAFRVSSPTAPQNSMKLTNISIPSYPNLPINKSANLVQILQTNMATSGFTPTRQGQKTINNSNIGVNPGLAANNVLPYNQPRNYSQAQIGNIDRRLTNVENELALSALEADVSSMNIPSSVSPNLNRFQYGFFVDNFKTSQYSDIYNPQYDAQYDIITGDVIPLKMQWDVSVAGNGPPDWIDSPIASQPIATNGSVTDPTGLGPVCALNLANTVAYTMIFRNGTDIATGNTDTVNVTFASNATVTTTIQYVNTDLASYLAANPGVNAGVAPGSGFITGVDAAGNPALIGYTIAQLEALAASEGVGPGNIPGGYSVTVLSQSAPQLASMPAGGTYVGTVYNPPVALYFYCFDIPTSINVYQNGTLIATTNTASSVATPQNLTQSDITLTEGTAAQQWFNIYPQFYMQNFVDDGGGFVSYAGKLVFNYDPSKGNNFTITTSSADFVWRWILAYPINGNSIGCVPPQQFNDVGGTYTQNWESIYIQCGNGGGFYGNMFAGYTEQWNSIPIPVPQTVTVPFDVNADWAEG